MTAVADGMKQEGLSQASQAFVATLECSGAGKLSITMVWFASRECGGRLSAKHPCVGCGVLLATSVQSRRREGSDSPLASRGPAARYARFKLAIVSAVPIMPCAQILAAS